jgi:hypothetical protein
VKAMLGMVVKSALVHTLHVRKPLVNLLGKIRLLESLVVRENLKATKINISVITFI